MYQEENTRGGIMMNKQEYHQFRLFSEEIQKYDIIDYMTMNVLLQRFSAPLRPIFNKYNKNYQQAKVNYYRYWLKILVRKNILIVRGMGYKVGVPVSDLIKEAMGRYK